MISQRGCLVLDYKRDYKLKPTPESKELDLVRIYNFNIPLYSPFEEVLGVLEELKADIETMQAEAKKAEEARLEESRLEESRLEESKKAEAEKLSEDAANL